MNRNALNSIELDSGGPVAGSLAFSDLNSTLSSATYKWLTPTLKLAQQQTALRPYVKCYIKDDSVIFSQAFSDPGQPLNGDVEAAPDGVLYAVGKDASGNLGVWRITDPSNIAQWTTTPAHTLLTSANWRNDLNTSLSISEYVNGSYVIDVYCWVNNAGALDITHFRSTNGGASFSSAITVPTTGLLNATTDNVYLSAGKPVLTTSNTVSGIVFWLRAISSVYGMYYDYYPGTGSTYDTQVKWSTQTIDSNDWVLHSLDSYYNPIDSFYYIVFSGYHSLLEATNEQFSLYLVRLQKVGTGLNTDIWSYELGLLSSLSSSTSNLNSFTLPKLNYDGSTLWLTFRGVTTESIKEDGSTVSHTNFFSLKSVDFVNYTYPNPFVSTSGVEFSDTNAYNFVKNGSDYYLGGSGKLWRFEKKNVVADVSDDLESLAISDIANSPSSLTLAIGNQDGKWVGPSPTETGASAVSKNKKVLIYPGYYNASQAPEIVPRNVYYIDDIRQNITNTRNDLSIVARDWFKKLRVLTTRFSYNFRGPDFFFDGFTGAFPTNWNQKYGNWVTTTNSLTPTVTPSASTDFIVSLSGINLRRPSAYMAVTLLLPDASGTGESVYVYPFWKDSNNWLRLSITSNGSGSTHAWSIDKNINGSTAVLDNGTQSFGYIAGSATYIEVFAKKYGYNTYSFFSGPFNAHSSAGDPVDAYQFRLFPYTRIFKNTGSGQINSSGLNPYDITTVALGCNNFTGIFKNFKLIQLNNSLNIKELMSELGTKAEIFEYKIENDIQDDLYTPGNWFGTGLSTLNRQISLLGAGSFALKTDETYSDFEIEFDAKLEPGNFDSHDFSFVFRSQSSSDISHCYLFKMQKLTNVVAAKFVNNNTAIALQTDNIMMDTSYYTGDGFGTFTQDFNNTNVDLTQWHHYKVIANREMMAAFVDGVMMLGWFDTNISTNAKYSSGYIGFSTTSGDVLHVKNIKGTAFWTQINSFGMNPGDDFESSLRTVASVRNGYVFSDLFGRFKSVILSDTDTSTYAYDEQIWSQQVDNSDKEYVNQVSVIGSGVSAIARDNVSIGENATTRDAVIVDYKISTLKDAQDRANTELITFNKFNNSSGPKLVLNVGGEILDVVHLVNTGDNSSGVDETVRVYSQRINLAGSSGEYSIQMGTGKVS